MQKVLKLSAPVYNVWFLKQKKVKCHETVPINGATFLQISQEVIEYSLPTAADGKQYPLMENQRIFTSKGCQYSEEFVRDLHPTLCSNLPQGC
jgi:hypothetical protein